MVRTSAALKIDGYGKTIAGAIDTDSLNWYSGWNVFIKDISTGTANNSFSIDYLSTYALYDKFYDEFATTIAGGCSVATIKSTEAYACPTKASGAVIWSDVSPDYITYEVDQLKPVNMIKVRKKNLESYSYTDLDGYSHEMFLLFGFTESVGGLGGDPRHYMFWTYVDSDGNYSQVPNSSPFLPDTIETFDILVPVSVNVRHAFWTSGLFQSAEVTQSTSGGSIVTGSLDIVKQSITISTANECDGTDPLATADISNLAGSNNVILGFLNGMEVNVAIKTIISATTDDDVVFDTNSAGYPSVTNIYWNGTARATSNLGDLDVADVIRLYIPTA